jgi:hypothetical protein
MFISLYPTYSGFLFRTNRYQGHPVEISVVKPVAIQRCLSRATGKYGDHTQSSQTAVEGDTILRVGR